MIATPPRCFVIGPIGEAGSTVRRKADWVLHGLIKPVLEDAAFGYHVKRADQDPNPGSISDAMINDIYEADLVVADLTGFNPNAFYELGIRHAFQKPAIHIIAERGTKPPFDNQDQRTIEVDFEEFQHVEEAKRALIAAVTYVRGSDFKVSNPVTRARGFAELVATGDPKDVLIAELKTTVETMSERLRRLEVTSMKSVVPNSLNTSTHDSYSLNRFGEYYDYIRDAVNLGLQVPFEPKTIDTALAMERRDAFAEWYNLNRTAGWFQKVASLDDESFDYLAQRERLMRSMNSMQLEKLMKEQRRRIDRQSEKEE